MRILGRCLFVAVLALVICGTLFLVPTVWGKPWKVEHFYYRVLLQVTLKQPVLLSHLGLLEPYGITFHNDELADYSVDAKHSEGRFWRASLERLQSYDREKLDDPLSYDAMLWFLEDKVNGVPFLFHDYPVNPWIFGIQSQLPDDIMQTHRIENVSQAEDYITRVSKMGTALNQLIEGVRYRHQMGVSPPRFVFEKAISEMEAFIAGPAESHPLFLSFERKLSAIRRMDSEVGGELRDRLLWQIENTVYPGYYQLIEACREELPSLSSDDGVWKHPDGERYYRQLLRSFTTTDLSPDTIHQMGLDEVNRIQAEMRLIFEQENLPGESFAATIESLNLDSRFSFPDSDEAREKVLADHRQAVEEISAGLEPYFNERLSSQEIAVKRVPEFKEETAALAYYYPASLDGKVPGTLFVNLRDMSEIKTFEIRTGVFHELVPGHHFQWDVHVNNRELPVIRTVLPFMAYIEGWAMYAEALAVEMGFQEDPYDRLGYMMDDLLRACRLVVDTGIHHKRWSREQAIEYMTENSAITPIDIVSEVERFIVYPGHACSYKVGHLKMMELRSRAESELVEDFDLKEFHSVLLGSGALPIFLLEQVVDEWIATQIDAKASFN